MERRHHDWEARHYAQESQAKSLVMGLLAYQQLAACLSNTSSKPCPPRLCPPTALTHPCKSRCWGQCDVVIYAVTLFTKDSLLGQAEGAASVRNVTKHHHNKYCSRETIYSLGSAGQYCLFIKVTCNA